MQRCKHAYIHYTTYICVYKYYIYFVYVLIRLINFSSSYRREYVRAMTNSLRCQHDDFSSNLSYSYVATFKRNSLVQKEPLFSSLHKCENQVFFFHPCCGYEFNDAAFHAQWNSVWSTYMSALYIPLITFASNIELNTKKRTKHLLGIFIYIFIFFRGLRKPPQQM